ncbi:hypothetical protein C0J52_02314, partial [Blattella germanica]
FISLREDVFPTYPIFILYSPLIFEIIYNFLNNRVLASFNFWNFFKTYLSSVMTRLRCHTWFYPLPLNIYKKYKQTFNCTLNFVF